MYKLCDKILDLMNFKERFMSKLANSISELDDVAKLCSGLEKKKSFAVHFHVLDLNLIIN